MTDPVLRLHLTKYSYIEIIVLALDGNTYSEKLLVMEKILKKELIKVHLEEVCIRVKSSLSLRAIRYLLAQWSDFANASNKRPHLCLAETSLTNVRSSLIRVTTYLTRGNGNSQKCASPTSNT